jgi:hypothetical protein
MFATGENGQFQLMLNMQPAVTIVNPFPMLEICAKTHIPQFLLKYKVAKLSAPIGTSKSLKSCTNPMLWPTVIKILTNPMISVEEFKARTTDAEIYAALLKKYGAKTDDEAMLLLKNLEFKFDDSKTPQEQFLGALQQHFIAFKEQLAQFLYCDFAGDQLEPAGILLCLKDNFLHNPFIKGPKGNNVRMSSNNAFIIEKLTLWKHLPLVDLMSKIEDAIESEDNSSRRKGYNVVPWNLPKPSEQGVRGGIAKEKFKGKNNQQFRNNSGGNGGHYQVKERCCKCGRFHEATAETCVLFDHQSAGTAEKWPEGKAVLIIEDKTDWTKWLDEKAKTLPDLVEKIRPKKPQGNHGGGGGRHPRYPQNQNNHSKPRNSNGKFVNRNNCQNFIGVVKGRVHESDGENTGDADHVTDSDDAEAELSSKARTRVETPDPVREGKTPSIEKIICPAFHAIGRFKRGKTKVVKNYPSHRRYRTVKTMMDPGAEGNFIKESLLNSANIQILQETHAHRIQILQNESPMSGDKNGACDKVVLLQFNLDLRRKSEFKHKAWFIVSSDIAYDAVVGRLFCKENGLTRFDELLSPWVQPEHDEKSDNSDDEQNPDAKKTGKDAANVESTEVPVFLDEEMLKKQKEFDAAMAVCPPEMFEKFASKHPVTGRAIIRNPNAAVPVEVEHRGLHK